ncbi:MFS general substrate transporter [Auriculariales sp. MPI-PUGE-AT-0066]|nr:MFS general substrate transporter [Auriculariales sp. MPI-PUGE-AT-0066]
MAALPNTAVPVAEHATTEPSQTALEKNAADFEHIYSDGGSRAWFTVFGAWLSTFAVFGLPATYGVFETYYVTTYLPERSSSEVAWIGSVQICLMFVMGLVVGRAFDRGHFHALMISGSLLYVFGLFMLSLSSKYYQIFLSQGVACGLGLGLCFLPTAAVLAQHFKRKRALAVGIAYTGSSVGGIVFTIVLNKLFSHSFGLAVRVTAAIVGAALLVANLVMRTGARSIPRKSPNPMRFFLDRDYSLGLTALCLQSLAIYFPVFYIQLDAERHGVDKNLASYTLTIYNAASVPGRILPNILADRFGVLNVTVCFSVLSGVIVLGMLGIKNSNARAVTITISALYGFTSGTLLAMVGAIIPALSRSVHEVGLRTGVAFLCMGLFNLLGGPLQGWLLGPNYEWWRAITFSSVLLIATAAFMAGARRDVARRQGSPRV